VLVLLVWIGALVLAGVIVAFCVYELSWKSKRLHTDLATLHGLQSSLTVLQDEVTAVQQRLTEVRP
jgi:hypothetical protein